MTFCCRPRCKGHPRLRRDHTPMAWCPHQTLQRSWRVFLPLRKMGTEASLSKTFWGG